MHNGFLTLYITRDEILEDSYRRGVEYQYFILNQSVIIYTIYFSDSYANGIYNENSCDYVTFTHYAGNYWDFTFLITPMECNNLYHYITHIETTYHKYGYI